MDITHFLIEQALIMVPALWVIGEIIKYANAIDNKYIPVILLMFSLFLTPMLLGGYNAENIVQAILVAGASVFSDQLLKQLGKEVE